MLRSSDLFPAHRLKRRFYLAQAGARPSSCSEQEAQSVSSLLHDAIVGEEGRGGGVKHCQAARVPDRIRISGPKAKLHRKVASRGNIFARTQAFTLTCFGALLLQPQMQQ